MGARSDWKKLDELAAHDLDAGCREIVNQSAPGRRRLKKVLRRMARKQISRADDELTVSWDMMIHPQEKDK